jgi:Tol biopolymer transport system component
MRRVIRRALIAGGVVGLLALGAGGARAAAPEGPRLAFIEWSGEHRDFAVIGSNAGGTERRTLAGGRFSRQVYEELPLGERPAMRIRAFPIPVSRPSWSPDGSSIAFTGWKIRTHGPHRWGGGGIFVVGADGNGLRLIRAAHGLDPVFAPDGRTLAFAVDRSRMPPLNTKPSEEGRYERASVWTVGLDGSGLRQVTPWRNGILSYPSSFSPDGSTLAVTQYDQRNGLGTSAAVAVDLDGGEQTTIASHAEEPVYSPDGSEVAFLHVSRLPGPRPFSGFTTDLMLAASDGSGVRPLTDTLNNAEQSPSWDPSGQRIAYIEYSHEFPGAEGNALEQINVDGTCRTNVIAPLAHTLLYGPAWQPGPSRGAGRIAC